jgi:hypothetical protein
VVAHLFIVARQEPELYKYLFTEFSSEDDVRVILDRRVAERRRAGDADAPPSVERRQRDRRAQAHVAQQLTSLGYAFVRVETARQTGGSAPAARL